MTPFAFESKLLADASTALAGAPVETPRAHLVLADLFARAPVPFALGIRLMVLLTPLLPLLLLGRLRFFRGLSPADRAAVFARALSHRSWTVRQLAMLYKTIACLCLYDDDVLGVA